MPPCRHAVVTQQIFYGAFIVALLLRACAWLPISHSIDVRNGAEDF
jgi:hypothetical protein